MKITLEIERTRRPDNDEVLVEGSYFARSDLPRALGNYMRTADDYGRRLKEAHAKLEDLQRSVVELKRADTSEAT
jgi:hypothetical protein